MAGEETAVGGLGSLLKGGLGPVSGGLGLLVSALFVVSLLQGMKDRKKMQNQEEQMRLAQEQATMGGGMGMMGGGMGGRMGGQIDPQMLQQAMMGQGQGLPY